MDSLHTLQHSQNQRKVGSVKNNAVIILVLKSLDKYNLIKDGLQKIKL